MKMSFRSFTKAFISMLVFQIISFSQSKTMYDVFPLSLNRTYTYSYEYRFQGYDLAYLTSSKLDSGTVKYIVVDSISLSDTTIQWTVKQQENLYHQELLKTSYWSSRDTMITLIEKLLDKHEITCSSWVWSFPVLYQFQQYTVNRYADTPTFLLGRRDSTLMGSDFNIDTLRFDASQGFYSRNSGYQYIHNTKQYFSLDVRLLSTSTCVNSPFAQNNAVMEFQLFQNYPNPFNPSTTIRYYLNHASRVSIFIYNNIGQNVRQLVSEEQGSGFHQILFNGSSLSSGIYFYRLVAGGQVLSRSLLLLK